MALDLSNTLVVGISATALFDMRESDQAALEADPERVIDNYRRYMQAREGEPMAPGTGYHLVKALLDLNQNMKGEDTSPLVEVMVMSRNRTDTGNRFEKQALDFIPVMLACGASSGEALDHLLSTRVMRPGKVTGRYNVGAEAVRNLKDALETFWVKADLDGDPRKSLELLDADIRRLEGRS